MALITTLLTDVLTEVDRRLARMTQVGTADVGQVFVPVTGQRARRPHFSFTQDHPAVPRFGAESEGWDL